MDSLYKKASKTFFINVAGLVIAFLFQFILGRVLQPEIYGQYTMFTIYVNIFTIFTVMGMDRNLIKQAAKVDKNKKISYIKFSLKISFILFIIVSSFAIYFWSNLQIYRQYTAIFIGALLIKSFALIIDGYLQGLGKIVRVTMINTLLNNTLKILLFLLFVVLIKDGGLSSILSFTISETICLICRINLFDNKINFIRKKHRFFTKEEKHFFLKSSFTFALISGISIILQNIDKVMINSILGSKSVGIYKVSQNYVALIGVFISPFMAFWPTISKLYNENKINDIEKEMNKITKIIASLAIPMFFIFFFLDEKILLIFGIEYTTIESRTVLIILAAGALFDAIAGPIGSILTMTKYEKYALANNVITAILNIILSLVFIRKYGLIGAALATGISIIISNLISIVEVKVLLNIFSYNFGNIKQMLLSISFNILICKVLIKFLSVVNIFIYIITFGILVYLCNILILLVIYKNNKKKGADMI